MLFNEPRRRFVSQTWIFNANFSKPSTPQVDVSYKIKFICDGTHYDKIEYQYQFSLSVMSYLQLQTNGKYKRREVYTRNKWADNKYRTITLLEEPSADLLTFLQKNAVLQ